MFLCWWRRRLRQKQEFSAFLQVASILKFGRLEFAASQEIFESFQERGQHAIVSREEVQSSGWALHYRLLA
jgi:hypothetical protein